MASRTYLTQGRRALIAYNPRWAIVLLHSDREKGDDIDHDCSVWSSVFKNEEVGCDREDWDAGKVQSLRAIRGCLAGRARRCRSGTTMTPYAGMINPSKRARSYAEKHTFSEVCVEALPGVERAARGKPVLMGKAKGGIRRTKHQGTTAWHLSSHVGTAPLRRLRTPAQIV